MGNRYLGPIIIAVIATVFIAACAGADITKTDLVGDVLIVDVRTPGEFEGEHFAGAINIPYDQVAQRLDEFGDKGSAIVVYCRSGRRSGIAKTVLEENGFTNVKNGGGLRDMKKVAGK